MVAPGGLSIKHHCPMMVSAVETSGRAGQPLQPPSFLTEVWEMSGKIKFFKDQSDFCTRVMNVFALGECCRSVLFCLLKQAAGRDVGCHTGQDPGNASGTCWKSRDYVSITVGKDH